MISPHRQIVLSSADVRRFWTKVDKPINPQECWVWKAGKSDTGYGNFGILVKGAWTMFGAHRISYVLHGGNISNEKPCVLHRCDNRPCVNPDHLFLGTRADNSADMGKKGRSGFTMHPETVRRGEKVNTSKLTAHQVAQIRKRYSFRKVTTAMLSREFGVHKSNIAQIVRRTTWRHVA